MRAFPVGFVGIEVDGDLASLAKRDSSCVVCPTISPSCPSCDSDESCTYVTQSCTACAQAVCVKKTTSSSSSSSGPNVGAIAGGVIGGLVVIAVLTYLVWRFCVKNKRGSYQHEQAQYDGDFPKELPANEISSARSARASTYTAHSIASTVLTRASNIIQIAYIPGVTNRATPTSPNRLVPPVPPIPIQHAEGYSSPHEEQHFFVPGDLRDSRYSGFSSYSDRTSYARTSYAPRSSVASTIYGKNAVVSPLPAQKGNFLKPSIVSVKSRAPSTSSGDEAPPVPVVDYGKYENDKPPPSPAFSIGDTFFKNANAATATTVRPQMIRVGSGPKTVDVKSKSPPATVVEVDASEEPWGRERDADRKERDSAAVTIIEDTPPLDQGPFSDPPVKKGQRASTLSAVMEESARRVHGSSRESKRSHSPFGDQHALRE
ncbi:hypothetical protein GGR56DRAFT_137551 [Xylariaceae sp. FL0804]|nr:hypothetical protein GGR56DRAFT_137551 [Xylariaceae sp. FL0804]